jgi:hypothetical protein
MGRPIRTPQGTIRGFRGREVVVLPAPFGRRSVYNFDGPEYDLFPELLGVTEVRVKVGFELPVATLAFATLARLSSRYGLRTARALEWLGKPASSFGQPSGAVMTELFGERRRAATAAIVSREKGQLMAALPAIHSVEAILKGAGPHGARTAYEFLGAEPLLGKLAARGCELQVQARDEIAR